MERALQGCWITGQRSTPVSTAFICNESEPTLLQHHDHEWVMLYWLHRPKRSGGKQKLPHVAFICMCMFMGQSSAWCLFKLHNKFARCAGSFCKPASLHARRSFVYNSDAWSIPRPLRCDKSSWRDKARSSCNRFALRVHVRVCSLVCVN